jgi:hypothetical protein
MAFEKKANTIKQVYQIFYCIARHLLFAFPVKTGSTLAGKTLEMHKQRQNGNQIP